MRIALLLPAGDDAGARLDAHEFLAQAVQRGHHCALFASDWRAELPEGVVLREIAARGRSAHRRHAAFVEAVQQQLAGTSSDVVVGLQAMPGLDVLLASAGCYLQEAEGRSGWSARRGGAYRYFSQAEAAVCGPQATTRVLFQSELQREAFCSTYPQLASRSATLPPGVAAARRPPADAQRLRRRMRAELQLAEHELVLLFAGNDFERHGLGDAIHSLAAARQEQPHQALRLLVAGGERSRRYHHLARKLGVGDAVHFLGWRDDLPELMACADVLIHPAREAPVGRVLLEALLAGLPVITSQNCGYAQHIAQAHAGSVLPEPLQPADLERALLRMFDGVFRSQCRETGAAFVGLTDLGARMPAALAQIEQWFA
ncbi:glycosyltransferase [Mangrovimicrobium sediminis]|uniref:Glycosyltransferase n=1 Tax=Mangrovimicrobium sediminis TaxID=2562682 RepID=A0A4Z0LZV8_9GAMM|nr:glycosyltransferase family 4 protein [Haliea sp. SAOS-164]TGD72942.1 glycosyltransferase [Haliea sp. SAOS-164]